MIRTVIVVIVQLCHIASALTRKLALRSESCSTTFAERSIERRRVQSEVPRMCVISLSCEWRLRLSCM